jgi:hypothetical protein
MSKAEHPDWPNGGDRLAHPDKMGDKYYHPRAKTPTAREHWLSQGLILVDSETSPEDLSRSGLSIEQRQRLIDAVSGASVGGFNDITLISLDLADEAGISKEEFVQAEEERLKMITEKRKEDLRQDLERGTSEPTLKNQVFAQWDHSDPNNPKPPDGSFVFHKDITPQDLNSLDVTPGQTDRLITAMGNLFGVYPDAEGIPALIPGFANLDPKLKEDAVQCIEELGQLMMTITVQGKKHDKERRIGGIGKDEFSN